MSLLGRLEDLSLTDIIQIVFLSRRTGVLEIIDDRGRHTVLFRQGLVVNASAPDSPDLVTFLDAQGLIPPGSAKLLRQMEDSGIAYGAAVIEMNLMSKLDFADAVRNRILSVVAPLLESREGEFNFILSDAVSPLDIEYDPDAVFKEGGISPQRLLGTAEGEKIKPLRGLEESLKAGKALLRGASTAETTPASLNLGLGTPLEPPSAHRLPGTAPKATDNVLPFPTAEPAADKTEVGFTPLPLGDTDETLAGPAAEPLPVPTPAAPSRSRTSPGQFRVAGGLFEIESPEATYRNVVLYERNPLVRVAARRAFSRNGVKIAQFGSLEDVRNSIVELMHSNSFFVTFLEITEDDRDADSPAVQTLIRLKKRNPRLPVVMVDNEANLRRRHDLLKAGADLYLTKPTPARLQPGLAEEELALFADELVLFADRAFGQWELVAGGHDTQAGKRFYEMVEKENLDRSFSLLKQLINELSNPNDISQVSQTILRLSAEYLERGVLFMVTDDEFAGLGGFGATGGGEEMSTRIRQMRIERSAPSLLADVLQSNEAHRGKMRRTPANVELIERLGGLLPTEVVALPILHGQRTIGILYGDNAEHRAPIDSMTGLEIFLSQAGYAFGNAVFASGKTRREQ
ncbi:MAG TPA: DUF4388 domain-containing protein [Thermoanaerobaculia bacterium]|nr:DUF4388 domain-containing protein [Thermoanaerobaculia bacterium]